MTNLITPFRVFATAAISLFAALSAHAVWDLGFQWYGLVAVVGVLLGFLYEVWFVSHNEEQYRIGILKSIEGYRGENVKAPRNLMDAKEIVSMLKEDREILADAYVSLYRENKLLESARPDTDDFMAGIEDD